MRTKLSSVFFGKNATRPPLVDKRNQINIMNVDKIRFYHAPKETLPLSIREAIDTGTYTYVVYCPGNILTKIGKSSHHLDRLRGLQLEFGKLLLIKAFKGDREKSLHEMFKNYSADLGREWFSLSKNQLDFISRMK